MKRPNQYSKPLVGVRTESYHPADHTNNQYAKDLNTYIDYLEKQQERMYSEEEVINAFNEGQALTVRGKLIQGKEWFEQFKKK